MPTFGGHWASALTDANNSMEFPWFIVRAAAESCGRWRSRRCGPCPEENISMSQRRPRGSRALSVTLRLEADKLSLGINNLFC